MTTRQSVSARVYPGVRFGMLVVVAGPWIERGHSRVRARCDCGAEKVVRSSQLLDSTKSCGCLGRAQVIPMIGRRFGRLVVIARAGTTGSGSPTFEARCDCGSITIVMGANLRNGNTVSCGCFMRSNSAARGRLRVKHGACRRGQRHREYMIWAGMIQRCSNPDRQQFANYGGRGIRVCARWAHSFEAFLADMGPRPSLKHTLDRINNDGDYEPGNCRWATPQEQANNKRSSRLLTMNGETLSMMEWARRFGISYWTLRWRLDKGISLEQAARRI